MRFASLLLLQHASAQLPRLTLSSPPNGSLIFSTSVVADLFIGAALHDSLHDVGSDDHEVCIQYALPERSAATEPPAWSPLHCESELETPTVLAAGGGVVLPRKFVLSDVPLGAILVRGALRQRSTGASLAATPVFHYTRANASVRLDSPAFGAVLAGSGAAAGEAGGGGGVWLEGEVAGGFVAGRDGLLCVHAAGPSSPC